MEQERSEPRHPTGSSEVHRAALRRAEWIVADTVGELMGFWNFKPSLGRVWTVLYLAEGPLSAEELARRAELSAGAVSMALAELQRWGAVRRVPVPGSRVRRFEAETDIVRLVTRVFRERELALVERAIARFEEALAVLDEEGRSSVPAEMLRSRVLHTRVQRLATLARVGRSLVERLVRAGEADLSPLRGVLGRG